MKKEVEEFLAQELLLFSQALALYKRLPIANAAQVARYEKRRNAEFMRSHIVGTLEIWAGLPESGRMVLSLEEEAALQVQAAHPADEEQELQTFVTGIAPAMPLKVSAMTPEQRRLVVENRGYQAEIDKLQKALFETGEGNTPELLQAREVIIAKIEVMSKAQMQNWLVLNPQGAADNDPTPEQPTQSDTELVRELRKLEEKLQKQQKAARENKTEEGRANAAQAAERTKQQIEDLSKKLC